MAAIAILGVAGAGAMGAGIAQIGLTAGLAVILYDTNASAPEKARADILARIARLVEKGQLPPGATDDAAARLTLAGDLDGLATADIVIEAIIEKLEPKQALFKALEQVVRPDVILASNTSSLSIAAIGAHCASQGRICGLHFFNPVPLMKLVEIVAAPGTSELVVREAATLCETLGKVPVIVRDGPGFLVNLAGRAYTTESLHIVQEQVASPETVDRIMRDGAGFRMGPFELMDLTGIDVNFPATTGIYAGYQFDLRLKTTSLHELMFNAGRFGRKTAQGYHTYRDGTLVRTEAVPEIPPARGFAAKIAEPADCFAALADAGLMEGGTISLIAPLGEDASTVCARLSLDPAHTAAIDFTALPRKHLTVMAPPGGRAAASEVAAWLRGHGYLVEVIGDSPGFVLQRVLAMIANLGCELAQLGVGSPRDIDTAMKLAQNYPEGPLEWADHLGPARVHDILLALQNITGSDRYRPSLWLRRRALLGLPVHLADTEAA